MVIFFCKILIFIKFDVTATISGGINLNLKKIEIEDADLNKLEYYTLEKFAVLNFFFLKNPTTNTNLKFQFKDAFILSTGDHFYCSFRVKLLIDKNVEILKICEKHLKMNRLGYERLKR